MDPDTETAPADASMATLPHAVEPPQAAAAAPSWKPLDSPRPVINYAATAAAEAQALQQQVPPPAPRVEDSPAPAAPSEPRDEAPLHEQHVSFSPQQGTATAPAAAAAATSSSATGAAAATGEPPRSIALKQELAKIGCAAYAAALGNLLLPGTQAAPDPGDKGETPRYVRSIADLAAVSDWEAVVPVTRHRDTIRAYLHSLSRTKAHARRERTAAQSAVQGVMRSLEQLDGLCDEKVGLERRHAAMLHPQQRQRAPSGTRSCNVVGSGGDDKAEQAQAVKRRIAKVVEELDAARARLQSAVGELPAHGGREGSAASTREERLAARPRPWASAAAAGRPNSATATKHTPRKPAADDGGGGGGDDGYVGEHEGGLPRGAFIVRPEELHPRFGCFSRAGASLNKEHEAKQYALKQEALRQRAAVDAARQHIFSPPMPPRSPPPPAAAAAAAAAPSPAPAAPPPTTSSDLPTTSAPQHRDAATPNLGNTSAGAAAPFPYARVSVFKADFEHAERAPILTHNSLNCKPVPNSPRARRDKPSCRVSPERQVPVRQTGVVGVGFGCGGAPPIRPGAAPSNTFFDVSADSTAGAARARHGSAGLRRPGSATPGNRRHGVGLSASASGGGGHDADPNVELMVDMVRGRDAELQRLRAKAASANPFYKKWGAAARAAVHGTKAAVGGGAAAAAAASKDQTTAAAKNLFPAAATTAASGTHAPTKREPSPAFWGTTSSVDETLALNARNFALRGTKPPLVKTG